MLDPEEEKFDLALAVRVGALDGRHPELEEPVLKRLAAALKPEGKVYIDGGDPLREVPLDKYRQPSGSETSTPIPEEILKSLGAPARRALLNHQILSLEILSTYSGKELLRMHGLGKSAIPKLEAALQRAGRSLSSHSVVLKRSILSDLQPLFDFQLDPDAKYQAAFTSKDPTDKNAYLEKYTKLLNDLTIHMQTITVDGAIAGSISKYEMDGEAEITYWIGKDFWGKGVATAALQKFLALEPARPLHARTAVDNAGSRKVLERCGFVEIGRDRGFANARQAEVEEVIYQLS